MSKKYLAAIPKDLASKNVNDLTISELKKVLQQTGFSKVLPFMPEKKKVEIELDPPFPRIPRIPDIGNEKKKVELEVPTDFFNAGADVNVEQIIEDIANEWKKAAIEVDDLLSQVTVFERGFFQQMAQAIETQEFK